MHSTRLKKSYEYLSVTNLIHLSSDVKTNAHKSGRYGAILQNLWTYYYERFRI